MIPSEWQIPIVVLTGLLGFGICLVLSEFSTRKNLVSISSTKKQAETPTTTKPGISLSSALSSSSNQGLRSNGLLNNDTVTGAGGSLAASSLVTTTLVTDLISMTTDSPTTHLQPQQHQQEPFDEDNDQGTSSLLSEPLKTPAKKRKSTNKLGLNSSDTGNNSELTGLIETPGGRRSARILRKVQQQQEKQE